MTRARRTLALAAYLCLVALVGAGVWSYAWRDALDGLARRGATDLSLAADRLSAQLFRYRELAVVLSRHPVLAAALDGGAPEAARAVVVSMADMTGAEEVDLLRPDGRIVVSSRAAPIAQDPAVEPLARALTGALGTAHGVVRGPDGVARRVFTFAAPVFGPGGQAVGAVAVEAGVAGIEENWPGSAPAVFFSDTGGQIFISNRSELVLANRNTGFPPVTERRVAGHELWRLEGGPYLPALALHLSASLPAIGMRAELLEDTAAAHNSALLQAAVAMASMLVFGGVLALIIENRRALALRLAAEAEENARLEARVAERTRALSEANVSLTHEVAERKEAEAALKRAQGDLVQAEKLAALGKMSAGISHELNQPLMAIRSFAENAEQFFERGSPDKARLNLGRIAELARRMGRIIQNLRAFARQDSGPVGDVDLARVIERALETSADKIARHEVVVNWAPPGTPVMVRGGEVRLEQVVVNLISNAVDAMAEAEERRLNLALAGSDGRVRLTVGDTGPGIAEPERVFDPFYTTKKIGAAEGMGLGLSISYGLVQGFGGTIRAANAPGGGAVFTVELAAAKRAVA
jgi:two-component system C4-dicarboxylate transport sensor histidine kinase DctB